MDQSEVETHIRAVFADLRGMPTRETMRKIKVRLEARTRCRVICDHFNNPADDLAQGKITAFVIMPDGTLLRPMMTPAPHFLLSEGTHARH